MKKKLKSIFKSTFSYKENRAINLKLNHLDLINEYSIFDETWYLNEYPDVKNANIDAFKHYINSGWKEGRDPHFLFKTASYLESEPNFIQSLEAHSLDPLQHYHQSGKFENRPIYYTPLTNFYKNYTTTSEPVIFSSKSTKVFQGKSVAIIHCFYPEIGEILIDQCLKRNIDVCVSVVEGTDYDRIINKFGEKITYRVFENHGRDILPFILGFKDILAKYDYALHLHTKKSLHYGFERNDWLSYITESLLDNCDAVYNTLKLENCSIVFPEPPSFLKHQMNWGHNFERTRALLKELGYDLELQDKLDFPAGSMFWFDVKNLKPIFDLNISPIHFEQEYGQVDGTLAHAFERLFGVYTLKSGKEIIPIRYKNTKYFKFEKNNIKPTEFKHSGSEKNEESYNKILKCSYPELSPLTFEQSKNTKKRINILLPTVNPENVFGGISTAVDFYTSLLDKLDCDGRIIITDDMTRVTSLENFKGYSNYNLSLMDDNDSKQILSCNNRISGNLIVRENDIFIATAWWTANHLEQISKFQSDVYGISKKHIYLVQDYEPHFYTWSSKSQLADSTYNNEWIKIYNTSFLYDYFNIRNKHRGDAYILKPDLNINIKEKLQSLNKSVSKEKVVIFYGRPSAERNCLEIILEAIDLWRSSGDYSDWKVISLGEYYTHPSLNRLGIDVFGKVTLSEYAEILAKSSIGVSLMVSPHPSYPPFEMAFSNINTFTNRYDNKNLEFDNIHSGNVCPNEIANFLINHCSKFNENRAFEININDDAYGGGNTIDYITSLISDRYK